MLTTQALGCLVIVAWSSIFSLIFFRIFKAIGRLRVPQFYEVVGIDLLMHQSQDNLKRQKLQGEIYDHQDALTTMEREFKISAFKSDTQIIRMSETRKKALIASLQNYQRKDV